MGPSFVLEEEIVTVDSVLDNNSFNNRVELH